MKKEAVPPPVNDPAPQKDPPLGLALWSWLPLPLLALLAATQWIADARTSYEAPRLLLGLNLIFSTLVALVIAVLCARQVLVRREAGQLLLGCGMLAWGLTAGVAVLASSPFSPNFAITVHNLGIWVFAACQLTGVLLARRRTTLARPSLWLAVACAGVLGFTVLSVEAAHAQRLPLFFLQGQGGTPLRQAVLGSAIGLLVITLALYWDGYRRERSPFVHWYGLGLGLLGLGLTGVLLQNAAGSALGWTSRAAQYLGGLYLLTGVLVYTRSSHQGGIPVPEDSLPAEGEPEILRQLQGSTSLDNALRYGLALGSTLASFGMYKSFTALVGPGLPTYVTFFPSVIIVAILAGPGPGLVSTILSVVLVDLWIVTPIGQFQSATPADRLGMVLFAVIGASLSAFAEFYRSNRRKAASYDKELALRDLLQRYELLAQNISDILLFVDRETGRILEANRAAELAYGRSREELLRLSIQELRAPETRNLAASQMAKADANGILFETWHQRNDGSPFPVEVSSVGTTIGGVRMLLSVIRDITRRRQEQEALQESEATLRAILDATQESIWLFDPDGTARMANRTALERMGLTPEEALGRRLFHLMTPDLATSRKAILEAVVSKGIALQHQDERSGMTFDSTYYPVLNAEGRTHRVAAFSRDITEVRRGEEQLKRINARVSLLAENASLLLSSEDPQRLIETIGREVMAFLDCQVFLYYLTYKEQGCLHLNAHAGLSAEDAARLEWLPCGSEECKGKQAHGLGPDFGESWNRWKEARGILALEAQAILVEGEVLGRIAFGTRVRTSFSEEDAALMKTIADQLSGAVQRIRAKESLQQSNDELQAANRKLALKSQELRQANAELVTSNLTLEQRVEHRTKELSTRMLQLKTLAGLVNRAEEQERQRIAQIIHDHLQQLLVAARLNVDTLLIRGQNPQQDQGLRNLFGILTESIQVARSLTAELYPSVLHQQGLAAALQWLGQWYQGQHGLTVEVETDPVPIALEPELRIMVFRAARELLFNVVKHSGAASARVKLDHPDEGSLRIEVSDQGEGFEPDQVQAGTGFGLLSMRERLELFGGHLEVWSAPGKGSRFTITVPIEAQAPAVQQAPAALVAPAPTEPSAAVSLARIRILLVDDHPVVREGLAQMLREEPDFEIVGQASNGLEAIEEARHLLPGVIVMDVAMPVLNGIEATRRILEELPAIQVLGLSMFDDDSHAHAMREAGAAAFLDKGGPIAIMKSTIRRLAVPS